MTYSLSLSQAVEDLTYLVTIPHTIDQIIGIYSEQLERNGRGTGRKMTNDEILSSIISKSEGGGGKGSHSDPTPQAALSGEPDDADETLGTIDGALATIADAIVKLSHRQVAGRNRTDTVARCVSELHRHDWADTTENDLILHIEVAQTADWLRRKCEGIWLASKGETLQPAVQKPIVECRICGPWQQRTVAVAAGRCSECDLFFRNHQCERTVPIVRRAEYGKGPTPAQMIEARAKKPARKRKTASA